MFYPHLEEGDPLQSITGDGGKYGQILGNSGGNKHVFYDDGITVDLFKQQGYQEMCGYLIN